MEASDHFHASAALIPVKNAAYALNGRQSAAESRCGLGEEKISWLLPGFECRTVQPVASPVSRVSLRCHSNMCWRSKWARVSPSLSSVFLLAGRQLGRWWTRGWSPMRHQRRSTAAAASSLWPPTCRLPATRSTLHPLPVLHFLPALPPRPGQDLEPRRPSARSRHTNSSEVVS